MVNYVFTHYPTMKFITARSRRADYHETKRFGNLWTRWAATRVSDEIYKKLTNSQSFVDRSRFDERVYNRVDKQYLSANRGQPATQWIQRPERNLGCD